MATTDVDFVAWDNSSPPQLWAWAGKPGDESSEPLYRLSAERLRDEWDDLVSELDWLRALWNAAVDAEGTDWARSIVNAVIESGADEDCGDDGDDGDDGEGVDGGEQ